MMSYLMYLSSVKCNDKFDLMSSMYFILLFALVWSVHLLLLWGLSLTPYFSLFCQVVLFLTILILPFALSSTYIPLLFFVMQHSPIAVVFM